MRIGFDGWNDMVGMKMVDIDMSRYVQITLVILCVVCVSGCVSTEELYAQYDAADCLLIASTDEDGAINLHEQNTDTHYPWEPAVFFAFDSADLADDQAALLDKSMQVLKQFPSLVVGVQGFTDKKGSLGYNKKLAQRRVQAVMAYLESNGIAANRVVPQPIGEVLPQIDPDDDIARSVNRRVELMLLDDSGRPLPVEYAMK